VPIPETFALIYEACFGSVAWSRYLARSEEPALRAVRLNTLRTGHALPAAWRERAVPFACDGYYIAPDAGLGKDPLHAAGAYYLQEPSAMAPVTVLAPQPGERVLDMCAAPGGKTTQIAALMHNSGILVANEPDRDRCTTLAQNIERMGALHTLVTHLKPADIACVYPGFFDAVLVDAPCSGEGMFRREPAAVAQWSESYILRCAALQLQILQDAAKTLKPGARLVYSTCTINPMENELTCLRLLALCPDLRLVDSSQDGTAQGFTIAQLTRIGQQWKTLRDALSTTLATFVGTCAPSDLQHLEYTRRILPHDGAGEGHFIACFRSAQANDDTAHAKRGGHKVARAQVDTNFERAWNDYADTLLTPTGQARLHHLTHVVHEDMLFATAHTDMPIKTRGVLRSGIALLARPHQHMIPAHALAMVLDERDVKARVSLTYGDPRALAYLQGEPFAAPDATDGWVHISLSGYPLGWGKAVSGVVKNHYPKGLRRRYDFASRALE